MVVKLYLIQLSVCIRLHLIEDSHKSKYNMCSYVLGAVFLQLCILLRLEENPVIQKVMDPSLFIHRFSECVFGGGNPDVSKTSLLIVASMKHDWMQTGRKPSGLCGSALSHGLKCSKSEIIKAVRVCEATLTKRLSEFEKTESGGLTIEEVENQAKKFGEDTAGQKASGSGALLCNHKDTGVPFADGLCEKCYREFMEVSGRLSGGSEPPAFQQAERKRIVAEEAAADSNQYLNSSMSPDSKLSNEIHREERLQVEYGPSELNQHASIRSKVENDVTRPAYPDSPGATLQSKTTHDTSNDRMESDFTFD